MEKLNPDPSQAPVVTKPRWSLPSLAEKLIKRACKIRLAMSYGLHKIAIITLTAPLVLLVVSTAESKDQIGKLFYHFKIWIGFQHYSKLTGLG